MTLRSLSLRSLEPPMTDSVSVGWPALGGACYARNVFARFLRKPGIERHEMPPGDARLAGHIVMSSRRHRTVWGLSSNTIGRNFRKSQGQCPFRTAPIFQCRGDAREAGRLCALGQARIGDPAAPPWRRPAPGLSCPVERRPSSARRRAHFRRSSLDRVNSWRSWSAPQARSTRPRGTPSTSFQ